MLKITESDNFELKRKSIIDAQTLSSVQEIVENVRLKGDQALREYSLKFGDISDTDTLIKNKDVFKTALEQTDNATRNLLEETANGIKEFALAQRNSIKDMEINIPGGKAGHKIIPVEVAGCYAPGGRFLLPSSVLMTAITAKVAGVEKIIIASPKANQLTLACAAIAEADMLICCGGAQVISAMAYGTESIPECNVIAGPGNKYVTAAKKLVSGKVRIDMLAGPSELAVLADATANPAIIACDLLAQAEHDPDAIPVLLTCDKKLIDKVNKELEKQLQELPTKETALLSLKNNGIAILCGSLEEAINICDKIAPEHLEICTEDPVKVANRCRNYGGIFIGELSAEVFGDYGAGPNHTLPTSGTAKYTGGLSVFNFLKISTWLNIDNADAAAKLMKNTARLAEIEGLYGHANAARRRI